MSAANEAATNGPKDGMQMGNIAKGLNSARNHEDDEELEAYEADLEAKRQAAMEGQEVVKEVTNEDASHREEKKPEGWEKRYADLRSHSQKQINALTKEVEALKQAMNNKVEESIGMPKTPEEIEEWRKEFPDVYDMIAAIASDKVRKTKEELQALQGEAKAQKNANELQIALGQIMEAHKDFLEIRELDEFHSWVEEQPRWVGESLYTDESNNWNEIGQNIIKAVKLFKLETGYGKQTEQPKEKKTKQKNTEREDAAASAGRSGHSGNPQREPNKIYESDVNRMSLREYEAKEEMIEQAVREGRFEYDVSGAAR